MPDFSKAAVRNERARMDARPYVLSPRRVALWSAVAAVAAVSALIAVAVVNDADALNTVALYLAVIAFVAQLVMYVAQNESSARQLAAAQDVQRDTSTMLRGIDEQIQGMRLMQAQATAKVIDALVDKVAPAEDGGPTERAPVRDASRAELREELREVAAEVLQEQSTLGWPPAPAPTAAVRPDPWQRAAAMHKLWKNDPAGFASRYGGTWEEVGEPELLAQQVEARRKALDALLDREMNASADRGMNGEADRGMNGERDQRLNA